MKYVIIPFISYSHTDRKLGEMLHDYVLSRLSRFPIDNFIFIGTHMTWEKKTVTVNGKTIQYIPTIGVHQENLQIAVNQLNDDDKFVIMDSDLMIYDYSIFIRLFDDLDNYDIVSNLDSGCTITPTYFHLWQKGQFPEDSYRNFMYTSSIFAPTPFKGGRGRFAATLFASTKKFWKQYMDNSDEYVNHESMEAFSRNVIKHNPNVRFKELLDFRFNIWVNVDNNRIDKFQNTDDTRCDESATKSAEYYHIRNFGETVKTVVYLMTGQPHVHHNKSETQRLLAWFIIVLEKLIQIDSSYSIYTTYIDRIRSETDISKEFYDEYMMQFKEFHRTHLL